MSQARDQTFQPPGIRLGRLSRETFGTVRRRPVAVLLLLAILMLPSLPLGLVSEALPRSFMAGRQNPAALAFYFGGLALQAVVFAIAVGVALQASGAPAPAAPWAGLRALPSVALVLILEAFPIMAFQTVAALKPDLLAANSVSAIGLLYMAAGLAGFLTTVLGAAFCLTAGAVAVTERRGVGASLARAIRLSGRSRWTIGLGFTATTIAYAVVLVLGNMVFIAMFPAMASTWRLLMALIGNAHALFWWLASASLYLDRQRAHSGVGGGLLETFD